MHSNYERRGKWKDKIYYKLDEESLKKYMTQMEKITHNDISIKKASEKNFDVEV